MPSLTAKLPVKAQSFYFCNVFLFTLLEIGELCQWNAKVTLLHVGCLLHVGYFSQARGTRVMGWRKWSYNLKGKGNSLRLAPELRV